jgi:C-terminal binding protein
MSHILNLYRQTHNLAKSVSNGQCIKGPDSIAKAACNGGGARRIRGQTLGIVGLGRIGMATALRAKPFGFNILFYDPYISNGIDKAIGVRHEIIFL